MTKRRHPTPLQDRQRRRSTSVPSVGLRATRVPVDGDFFAYRFALLRLAYDRASAVSKQVAGRYVAERMGWAQWIHLRQCIAVSSILTLADYQPRMDAGQECTLDQSSIASLARSVCESAAMVGSMADPSLTSEQWDLRKYVLCLHDATTRHRMFQGWGSETEAATAHAAMDELRARIRTYDEFNALPEDRRRRIIAGTEVYIHGLRSAIRFLGMMVAEFDGTYSYLSGHTHSSPVSFIKLAEHGVDFQQPTQAQRSIAGFAMEFAFLMLETTTDRIATLFNVEAPPPIEVPEFVRPPASD